MQQGGLLRIEYVAITGAVSVNGGELSLVQMNVLASSMWQVLDGRFLSVGSVVQLSAVTVTDFGQDPVTLTGNATVGANSVVYDPLDLFSVCFHFFALSSSHMAMRIH